jgi:N6-adenosine-specific RNA methylase IME4
MVKCVMMDPPWPEQGAGKIKRGADRWYGLIKKPEDILKVILQSDVWPDWEKDEGAHMYMWVTNNYLKWGMDIMKWLGFTYKTNIVWVKVKEDWPSIIDELIDEERGFTLNPLNWLKVLAAAIRIGIGQYFRGSHELVLFGTRGKAMMPEKAMPTVFHAPRERGEDGKEKHSKKPTRIYEIIEATSPGPYLEIFARSKRKNWTAWTWTTQRKIKWATTWSW